MSVENGELQDLRREVSQLETLLFRSEVLHWRQAVDEKLINIFNRLAALEAGQRQPIASNAPALVDPMANIVLKPPPPSRPPILRDKIRAVLEASDKPAKASVIAYRIGCNADSWFYANLNRLINDGEVGKTEDAKYYLVDREARKTTPCERCDKNGDAQETH